MKTDTVIFDTDGQGFVSARSNSRYAASILGDNDRYHRSITALRRATKRNGEFTAWNVRTGETWLIIVSDKKTK